MLHSSRNRRTFLFTVTETTAYLRRLLKCCPPKPQNTHLPWPYFKIIFKGGKHVLHQTISPRRGRDPPHLFARNKTKNAAVANDLGRGHQLLQQRENYVERLENIVCPENTRCIDGARSFLVPHAVGNAFLPLTPPPFPSTAFRAAIRRSLLLHRRIDLSTPQQRNMPKNETI